MDNNQNTLHINPAIVLAVILQLVFIVFAIITINNILNQNTEAPRIRISNYSAIPAGNIIGKNNSTINQDVNFTLSDADKAIIENTIYEVVSINNDGISTANHGAKIREDSARHAYIEDLNAYFLNFIVDIENLQQSYRFTWLGGNNFSGQETPKITSLMAFCPKEDEMIYNDFNCKDEYDGRGLNIVVYNLIRYHSFDNFSTILTDAREEDPLKITIRLYPEKDATEEIAVQELSEYLSELGINFNNFEYDFVQLIHVPLPDRQKTVR